MRPKPLEGIRVLDLTRLLPGPMCTLHLADMGADVIKIEDPRVGDYARGVSSGTEHAPSAYFQCVNRNKRGLRLDLAKPGGRKVFLDLAGASHAVVESFRPGVVDRLGVGYEDVKRVNPAIVYCAITGYGQTGPYRDRAGHDLNYCAYTGITDQIGIAKGAPAIPNIQFADLAGGTLSAVMGILAGLLDAQRHGQGRYVDVSMACCALANNIIPLAALHDYGATAPRGRDMLSGGLPCYAIYETADGRHMAIAAPEEKFWRAFCEAIERPDLIDKRIAQGAEAQRARAELATLFKAQPLSWWVEKLEPVDCCASPVLKLEESLDNEQLKARGMFVQAARPQGGELTQFAFPVKFSDFEFDVVRSAPARGEHNDEILAAIGYSDEHIAELTRDGVI